jgi:biopolymer transport protein ExbB/TolQ
MPSHLIITGQIVDQFAKGKIVATEELLEGTAPAHVVVDGLVDSLAATVIPMLVALSGVALYELLRNRGNDDDAA